jgi:tetratricopeptide (TPR) repeat protein
MISPSVNRIFLAVITTLATLFFISGKDTRAQIDANRKPAKSTSRLGRVNQKQENEKARQLLEDGLKRVDQKDWDGAFEAFRQALVINPQFGDAYVAMGDTYMSMGKYADGLKAYRDGITAAPSNPTVHYSLGAAYNSMAQYGDAFKHFIQAIQLDAKFAEAHYGIGYAYLKLDRFKDALVHLRRAVQLWPDSVEFHLAMGQSYVGLGDVRAAEKELKILSALDASAAADLEKDLSVIRALPERDVAKSPVRTERDASSESAPPTIDRSRSSVSGPSAAQTERSIPVRSPLSISKTSVPSADAGLAIELSFWESVKNSGDAEEFAAYLKKYPDGQFAELARIRMRALVAKGAAAVDNSKPKPPPPVQSSPAPNDVVKPGSQWTRDPGIAQQPKRQLAEELPAEDQPAKEQPSELRVTATIRPNEISGATTTNATISAALDSLRALLPANFSYQIRATGESAEARTVEVKVVYEALKFEGCTIKWRDQNDVLWVSLSELDPNAVTVEPRTRPGTTFSVEVWNVTIAATGDNVPITEAKGNGSSSLNRFHSLDLQYDRKEKAERLAEVLRQAITLCGGKS